MNPDPAAVTAAAKARRDRLIGIALMCAAVGTFSCLDTTAKYLGRRIDVMQAVWARYTFAFMLALIVSNPASRPGLGRTARPVLQIVRAGILLGSTMLNFFALKYLRLDQGARHHLRDPVRGGGAVGARVATGRTAALGRHCGRVSWRAGDHPAGGLASCIRPRSWAVLFHLRLCVLFPGDVDFVAIRFQPNHPFLFEFRRRGGDAAGGAFLLGRRSRRGSGRC